MLTDAASSMLMSQNTHFTYMKRDGLKLLILSTYMIEKEVVHGRVNGVKSEMREPSFRSPASLCPIDHGSSSFNLSSTTEARATVPILIVLDLCH